MALAITGQMVNWDIFWQWAAGLGIGGVVAAVGCLGAVSAWTRRNAEAGERNFIESRRRP